MKDYIVNKFFGHFWQSWEVQAESEQEAWETAEKNGRLSFQNVYRDEMDTDSKGYVVDLDKQREENKPIPDKQFREWLKQAVEKGMIVDDYYQRMINELEEF